MGRNSVYGDAFGLALDSDHQALAQRAGASRKYPANIAPFAALEAETPEALADLRDLMEPQEEVWICAKAKALPSCPGLECREELTCLQMVLPEQADLPRMPETASGLVPLRSDDRHAMVALTELAFPGFFREWTCRMGRYFGFREGETLVAMGGERLNFTLNGKRYREISGLCTHPAHRGRGHASALLAHLLALHRKEGSTSWLHVSVKNPAQELYGKLGFVTENVVNLRKLQRLE